MISATIATFFMFWSLLVLWTLKHIFQRKLHDPWIIRSLNLSEVRTVDCRDGISGIHVIRDIEGFRAELHRLSLPDFECARQAHVDRNHARSQNIVGTHRGIRAQ